MQGGNRLRIAGPKEFYSLAPTAAYQADAQRQAGSDPGAQVCGDHGITTIWQETGPALMVATDLLRPGGVLTVIAYTGHPGGADEKEGVERELRLQQNQLRSILDTVPDAMILIDGRGIMRFFSSAAERMFGLSEQEAIGQNISVLMPRPDATRHDNYIGRYRSTGERHIIGIGRIGTAGGSLRLFSININGTNKTATRTDNLNLQIDLTGAPILPPGTYSGTLNIEAVTQ